MKRSFQWFLRRSGHSWLGPICLAMGYPIAECYPDGRFVLCKPPNTGGRITPETIAEQIVYEIGDPGAYVLPDVCCDLRWVTVRQVGENRVEVLGVRGNPPPEDYKVSATYQDGYRCMGTMLIGGPLAPEKARRVGEALLLRTRALMQRDGYADYRRTDVEVLGAESNWGANARVRTREVLLKIALHHDDRRALEYFSKEVFASAASMAQGTTGFAGGRPAVGPLVRLFSFLIPKTRVVIEMEMGTEKYSPVSPNRSYPDQDNRADRPSEPSFSATNAAPEPEYPVEPMRADLVSVPLIALAYGRSGDKGDKANIGVLARKPEYLHWLRSALTPQAVQLYLAHLVEGPVERFELTGLNGFNFLLHGALGGGGVASLRYDPQGKMMEQILMDFPVLVPKLLVPNE